MSRKKQQFLTLYVDTSFIEELNEGLGAIVWSFIINGEYLSGMDRLKIGAVKNSTYAEYKIAESAVDYALNKIVKGRGSQSINLKLITDNLGLFPSFNKFDSPPVQTTLSSLLKRIRPVKCLFIL